MSFLCLFIMIPYPKSGLSTLNTHTLTEFFSKTHFMVHLTAAPRLRLSGGSRHSERRTCDTGQIGQLLDHARTGRRALLKRSRPYKRPSPPLSPLSPLPRLSPSCPYPQCFPAGRCGASLSTLGWLRDEHGCAGITQNMSFS
jgi:hypothetical protein